MKLGLELLRRYGVAVANDKDPGYSLHTVPEHKCVLGEVLGDPMYRLLDSYGIEAMEGRRFAYQDICREVANLLVGDGVS